MKISPIDIQQQQFKSRPFGYEKAGVDSFLERVAEELERLIAENQDLQEQVARLKETMADLRVREETLKETLVTTQKVTEEMKANARREAEVLLAETEVKAERLLQNAEDRRLQLLEEIQDIRRQKVDFEVSLRGLLERHIRLLGLNDVAIAHQDEAKLLEEFLPFGRGRRRAHDDLDEDRQDSDNRAQPADREEADDDTSASDSSDASTDFDPGGDNDAENPSS
ncbi:MAG: DivIVA domain-containing protein [Desulfuromonadales bacterium]|jgi:cell division initiation protein